jgi:hypothetical protein
MDSQGVRPAVASSAGSQGYLYWDAPLGPTAIAAGTIPAPMLGEALVTLRRALLSYLLLALVLAVAFAALVVSEWEHAPYSTFQSTLVGGFVVPPGTSPASLVYAVVLLALAGLIPTTWGLWRAAGKEFLSLGSFGPRPVQVDTQNARRLSLGVFAIVLLLFVLVYLPSLFFAPQSCGGHTGVPCASTSPDTLWGVVVASATVALLLGLPGAVIFAGSGVSAYWCLRRFVPESEQPRLIRGVGAVFLASGLWVAGASMFSMGPVAAGVMATGAVVLAFGLSVFVRLIAGARARLRPGGAGST